MWIWRAMPPSSLRRNEADSWSADGRADAGYLSRRTSVTATASIAAPSLPSTDSAPKMPPSPIRANGRPRPSPSESSSSTSPSMTT